MNEEKVEPTRERAAPAERDLSPTGLYTAGVWAWAGIPGSELLDHADARRALSAVTFALGAAGLFARRAPPSLRHSLVQRHVILDALVLESGTTSVIELAAGLSARGVRVTSDPNVTYVEVDQPRVVAKKRELLGRTDAGRAALRRPNLTMVAGDALALSLDSLLAPEAQRPVVIAEGLMMYLDATSQRRLFAAVAELLSARGGGAFAFDLVPSIEQPKPGALGRVLGGLMRALTRGGGFVRDARTRSDVASDLRAAGFEDVQMIEPSAAPPSWRVPHLEMPTQQLVFAARMGGALPA
jgi:O-methyltransferase involved in polyketide biosynthesis